MRLATTEQRAALHVALAAEDEAGPTAGGEKMRLDIEAEKPDGSLVGSLRPALSVAGMDWSSEYLRGLLGSAFAFSMQEDGGRLHQGNNYEWYLSPQIFSYLQPTTINASLHGGQAVSPEQHARAKSEAWEKVRGAIDDGRNWRQRWGCPPRPAIVGSSCWRRLG